MCLRRQHDLVARAHVEGHETEEERIGLLDCLDGLPEKARAKCLVRVERLARLGHEFPRPEADYLRDDIYELRAK